VFWFGLLRWFKFQKEEALERNKLGVGVVLVLLAE
jgi:hypothetical protein